MRGARASWWFLLAGALSFVGYYVAPDGDVRDVSYNAVGILSLAAMVVGIRRRRPRARLMWWLLTASVACFVCGDVIWNVYTVLLDQDPYPSVADAFYLAGYPILGVALARFGRRSHAERTFTDFDVAVFVAAGLVPLLAFVVLPTMSADDGSSLFGSLVAVAYPVGDLILLAVLVRLLLGGVGRNLPLQLFTVGIAGMLVADIAFARAQLDDSYVNGAWFDWLWMLLYVCFGAAALHPSMVRVDDTGDAPVRTAHHLRLAFLAAAAVVAPVVAAVNVAADGLSHVVVGSAAAAVSVLVVGRLGMTVRALDSRTTALSEAVVAREALTERLRHSSEHDSLTGLPNRDTFADSVRAAVAAGGHHVIAFCDLDEFKAVNDDHGHPAGDLVLRVVAERFKATMRPDDVVARLGGDEFGVLWRDVRDGDDAAVFAERLLAVLREPIAIGDISVRIGASVGMTLAGDSTREYADLLADADVAVYGAKRSGRGQAVFFDPMMREQILGPARLARRLVAALDEGALDVVFQPVLSARSRRVTAVEALVRWTDDGVVMAPDDFLPVAADHGIIEAVDRFVLDAAVEQFAGWADAPARLHVNASPQLLANPAVVELVRETLARHGVRPAQLTIEMTEYAFDGDTALLDAHFAGLTALGVSLTLDDFGTGYSSLSHLQRFPFDGLKLDRSLTALIAGGNCPPMLRAVVRLGHSLGLRVTAEGVETEAQIDALTAIGCDEVQGFGVGRPARLEELQLASIATESPAP